MVGPFRRRKSRTAALLQAPRAGVDRVRDSLPETHLTDAFLDLATRTGIDLGDLLGRGVDRLGDLAGRANEGAGNLKKRDSGKQALQTAAQARQSVAELAARAGAQRLSSAIAAKRPSRTPLVTGVLAGLAAGGVLAYFLAPRRGPELRARLTGRPAPPREPFVKPSEQIVIRPMDIDEPTGEPGPNSARTGIMAPAHNLMDRLRQRYDQARGEAKLTQEETQRQLWRDYDRDVRHFDENALVSRELAGGEPT
ncbi:MAG: YtxH domain-containing protein [Dehalococcoidia bacterium]